MLAVLAALKVFGSRLDTSLEILALRHQVAVLKTETPAPSPDPNRPAVLDHIGACLVAMVGCLGDRQTSDCDRLASQRISTVLALAIAFSR